MDEDAGGSPAAKAYCWTFGNAEFDEGRWQLRVAGHEVELERKPLEVLQYLLRHAGEAVTKDELLASVWAGRVVVEAVLTNAIGKLRRALADEAQDIVTTLPRVGYWLAVPVSRKAVEFLPQASCLEAGDAVPRRPNWRLETALARTDGNEVWLARHGKTRETRVFKFSLVGKGLAGLKREVTIARLLREALGEREDFVHVLDWDFEEAPFFVESEYGGVSLDHWPAESDIAQIPVTRRLALFVEAADAVAAAHGIGVLHKDLKPANLLIYGEGDEARLRVADFGSSRLFDSGRLDELGITHLGLTQTQALTSESGTPLYLAPEVIGGQSASIKSDVYALGVTLYQFLVGDFSRPLAPGWESDIDDPLLRQDIADAADGDPAKRMDSATMLADRIRNLASRREKRELEQAVQARVAEGEKRLAKMRARRPWMIAAMLALLVGLVVSASLLQRSRDAERVASEQRDKAEQQARRAETVVQYLSNDLIRSVTPEGRGFEQEPTIKEMVEYASNSVDESFKDDPTTRANLHAAIGASWASLFEPERSAAHYEKAAKGYAKVFGSGDQLTLVTDYQWATQLAKADHFDLAGKVLDETDRLAGERLRSAGELAFESAWSRGQLLSRQMKLDEAEVVLSRALVLQTQAMPNQQAVTAKIRLVLADVYQRQGKFTEVIGMMRDALADPNTKSEELRNSYRAVLAKMLVFHFERDQKGKWVDQEEALALAEQTAASTAKMQGDDALATLRRSVEIARVYNRTGDCPKALTIYRQVWGAGVGRYGETQREILLHGSALAQSEIKCGNKQAGMDLQEHVLESFEEHFPGDTYLEGARYGMATRLIDEHLYNEALDMLARINPEKMAAAMSSPAAKHWINVQRGRSLMGLGNKAKGRDVIGSALDAMVEMGLAADSPGIVKARGYMDE